MSLDTAQQRKHAQLLRERDASPAAQAVAAQIEAEAELSDALADRPAEIASSARMVEEVPILGHITRESGQILSMEREWTMADVARARALGVDIAWQWCHDPRAGLQQGELVYIWIGTRTGPLLQWDRTRRRWYQLCHQRQYGNNWACGGRWSCTDKIGAATLEQALAAVVDATAVAAIHAALAKSP